MSMQMQCLYLLLLCKQLHALVQFTNLQHNPSTLALAFTLLALASSCVLASDPSPLPILTLLVNGFVCKDPDQVKAEDFSFSGIDKPRSTANKLRSNVTVLNVNLLAGLNALGISLARIDFGPNGISFGPIVSNKLFTKTFKKGDVIVFPQGLIHFQLNCGHGNAVTIAALSSQNLGVITIANTVFRSKPPISDDVLVKAFQNKRRDCRYVTRGIQCNISPTPFGYDSKRCSVHKKGGRRYWKAYLSRPFG